MNRVKDSAWIAGAGALALLILVAAYLLLIGPARAEAAELATEKLSVEQSNEAVAQRTALLASQFETLPEKREQLADIRSTLPSSADIPALLRQVEAFSVQSGVIITTVTPGAAEIFTAEGASAPTSAAIVAIPLTVSTSGSFAQTELFVKNLQADMRRYFLVEDVSMTRGDEGSAKNTVTSTITGRIFVLQDAGAAADVAETTTTSTSTVTNATSEGTR